MNQLQNLLHDALTLTNHVAKCALIDFQNAKLTSSSIGYHPSQDTVNTLVDAFVNIDKIRTHGLDFDGVNYRCIRGDDEAIYTKEVNVCMLECLESTLRLRLTRSNGDRIFFLISKKKQWPRKMLNMDVSQFQQARYWIYL
jgi:hypothetical protein